MRLDVPTIIVSKNTFCLLIFLWGKHFEMLEYSKDTCDSFVIYGFVKFGYVFTRISKFVASFSGILS